MMACQNIFYLCTLLWFRSVLSEEEIGSPLRIAQCRAHCILKFSQNPESQKECFLDVDCIMCWENCQLLQTNFPIWGGICSEPGLCFPGCQEACRFHKDISPVQQSVPVIQTRGEEVIFVKNQTAYWPQPKRNNSNIITDPIADPLVYVVMRRLPGKMWRQITQTLETSSRVSDDLSSGALLRVLVVDRDGLFTIYSPIASESSLRSANDIARSSGQNSLNNLFSSSNSSGSRSPGTETGRGRRINTEILKISKPSENSSELVAEYTSWNLREISLIHQKVLVIAEIAWDAISTYVVQRPVYFVTWEVDGGGLKGNLFTDSTCVTLSLWPDTVYHIQVELVDHYVATGRPQQSEDFLLDTHRAIAVELETSSVPTVAPDVAKIREIESNKIPLVTPQNRIQLTPHRINMLEEKQQIEILLAVGAAFAVFLLVLVVLVYAGCRHSDMSYPRPNGDIFSFNPSKQGFIDSRFPNEFVPILTLVSENISKRIAKPVTVNSPKTAPKSESTHIPKHGATTHKCFTDRVYDSPVSTNSFQPYCDRNIKYSYSDHNIS